MTIRIARSHYSPQFVIYDMSDTFPAGRQRQSVPFSPRLAISFIARMHFLLLDLSPGWGNYFLLQDGLRFAKLSLT